MSKRRMLSNPDVHEESEEFTCGECNLDDETADTDRFTPNLIMKTHEVMEEDTPAESGHAHMMWTGP